MPLVSTSIALSSPLVAGSARCDLRPFLTVSGGKGASVTGCPFVATLGSGTGLFAGGTGITVAVLSPLCALIVSSRTFSDSGSSGVGPKNDFDGVKGIGLPSCNDVR